MSAAQRAGTRWLAVFAILLAALPARAAEPGSAGTSESPPAATPPVSARPPGPIAPEAEDAFTPGPSLDARLAEIRRRVQAALEYPRLARAREIAGETWVEFEIGTGREARAIRTVRSSGSRLLDRAAERAVAAAGPLPPVYGRLQVPVRFDLAD